MILKIFNSTALFHKINQVTDIEEKFLIFTCLKVVYNYVSKKFQRRNEFNIHILKKAIFYFN